MRSKTEIDRSLLVSKKSYSGGGGGGGLAGASVGWLLNKLLWMFSSIDWKGAILEHVLKNFIFKNSSIKSWEMSI